MLWKRDDISDFYNLWGLENYPENTNPVLVSKRISALAENKYRGDKQNIRYKNVLGVIAKYIIIYFGNQDYKNKADNGGGYLYKNIARRGVAEVRGIDAYDPVYYAWERDKNQKQICFW